MMSSADLHEFDREHELILRTARDEKSAGLREWLMGLAERLTAFALEDHG